MIYEKLSSISRSIYVCSNFIFIHLLLFIYAVTGAINSVLIMQGTCVSIGPSPQQCSAVTEWEKTLISATVDWNIFENSGLSTSVCVRYGAVSLVCLSGLNIISTWRKTCPPSPPSIPQTPIIKYCPHYRWQRIHRRPALVIASMACLDMITCCLQDKSGCRLPSVSLDS